MKYSFLATLLCAVATLLTASLKADDKPLKYVDVPGETRFDFGSDPMRYLENDRVKLGLDLSLGGAVVYLEDKANNSGNMINSFDWGRQIQLSYYSGPAPFIGPNGEKPSPSWAGLGWNPIQSGDCGGYRSQVLKFETNGVDEIFLQARPMLWPHSGVPAECLFECRYRLTEVGFVLDATIVNDRSDKTQYPGTSQETPALYTNAPWYKLVSYLGDKPFENEPVTVLVDKNDGKGWPWVGYYTPENWSALVNKDNYGVGVYQPKSFYASSGFYGGDANKGANLGPKNEPTGYIAPRETTILDWNIRRTYSVAFIVGSLDEIRAEVYKMAEKDRTPAPNWTFNGDRRNWTYLGAEDEGFPIGDSLSVNVDGERDAKALSPETFWKASDASVLEIDAQFVPKDATSSPDDKIVVALTPVSPADSADYLQWSEGSKDKEKELIEKEKAFPRLPQIKVDVPVKFDGERRTIRVDLGKIEAYRGAMKRLELKFPKRESKAVLYRVGFVQ